MDFLYSGQQGVLDQNIAPPGLNLRSMLPGLLTFAAIVWVWRKIK